MIIHLTPPDTVATEVLEEPQERVLFFASVGRIEALTVSDLPSSNVTEDLDTVSSAILRLLISSSLEII